MALHAFRVFWHDGSWWAAYVSGGVGAGSTPRPRITSESIIFTRLGEEKEPSRAARLGPHLLNRISHRSVVELLERARQWGETTFPAMSYGLPDPDEYSSQIEFNDDEGLTWRVRRSTAVRLENGQPVSKPAIELACMDDTALRKEILLSDEGTFDDALVMLGREETMSGLVSTVKSLFKDLDEDEIAEAVE